MTIVDNHELELIDGLPKDWSPGAATEALEEALCGDLHSSSYLIAEACLMLTHLLLLKNKAYGDSALNPLSVFAKSETRERLAVRMDDKLNRIARGEKFGMENERVDLAGYLVLDYIAAHRSES